MEARSLPVPGRGLIRLVVVGILACLAQIVLAQFLTSIVAGGHAAMHALMALVALLPALGIAWRWPAGGLATRAPVLGLVALATAQFVESIGAFGYGPDNDGRVNGIVVLHDLGSGLTALGLVAAVVGIAVGIGAVASRRQGRLRLAMLGAAAAVGVMGTVFIKTMIGL